MLSSNNVVRESLLEATGELDAQRDSMFTLPDKESWLDKDQDCIGSGRVWLGGPLGDGLVGISSKTILGFRGPADLLRGVSTFANRSLGH